MKYRIVEVDRNSRFPYRVQRKFGPFWLTAMGDELIGVHRFGSVSEAKAYISDLRKPAQPELVVYSE